MNPYKLKNVFEYLTSNNQLLKKKLKLGTDEIPIPPKRDDVTTIEAINRFNKANPRVDTTSLKPLSVKHSNIKQSNVNEPNEGAIQSAFDTATRDAQFEGYPAPNYEKFKSRYLKKNMKADGGRIGYAGAGLVKTFSLLRNLNKTGPLKGLEEKLIKKYKSEGMDLLEAIKKAQTEKTVLKNKSKNKILDDAMKETDITSDDYVELIDEKIKIIEPEYYTDIKRWNDSRPDLADKTRALFFPDWAEAKYGENYVGVLQNKQAKAIRENIDPNVKEPLSPSDQMVSDIDDMNTANIDEFFDGRKKNADGGRIGYKDGPKFDVQASGTKSGKQQIQGAPEGITSDKETINAILTMDIPLTEKVNLIGDLQYGKFRDKIEYNDDEIFLDDPKSYRDRNIGLDYNRGGEGFSGSATVGDRGPAFNIRYKKSFADGGMLVQPSDDGSRPGYKGRKGSAEDAANRRSALAEDYKKIVDYALNNRKIANFPDPVEVSIKGKVTTINELPTVSEWAKMNGVERGIFNTRDGSLIPIKREQVYKTIVDETIKLNNQTFRFSVPADIAMDIGITKNKGRSSGVEDLLRKGNVTQLLSKDELLSNYIQYLQDNDAPLKDLTNDSIFKHINSRRIDQIKLTPARTKQTSFADSKRTIGFNNISKIMQENHPELFSKIGRGGEIPFLSRSIQNKSNLGNLRLSEAFEITEGGNIYFNEIKSENINVRKQIAGLISETDILQGKLKLDQRSLAISNSQDNMIKSLNKYALQNPDIILNNPEFRKLAATRFQNGKFITETDPKLITDRLNRYIKFGFFSTDHKVSKRTGKLNIEFPTNKQIVPTFINGPIRSMENYIIDNVSQYSTNPGIKNNIDNIVNVAKNNNFTVNVPKGYSNIFGNRTNVGAVQDIATVSADGSTLVSYDNQLKKFNFNTDNIPELSNVKNVDYSAVDKTKLTKSLNTKIKTLGSLDSESVLKVFRNNKQKSITDAAIKTASIGGFDEKIKSYCGGKASGGRIGLQKGTDICPAATKDPEGFLKRLTSDPQLSKFFKSPKAVAIAKNVARAGLSATNPLSFIGGEIFYIGLDAANNRGKGQDWDEALDKAFVFYDFERTEKKIMEKGKQQGFDANQLDLLQNTMNLYKLDNRQKAIESQLNVDINDPSELSSDLTMGAPQDLENVTNQLQLESDKYRNTLDKMGFDLSKNESYNTGFNYLNNIFRKKTQDDLTKIYDERKRKVDPEGGPIGDAIKPIFDMQSYTQPLKYGLDIINPFTKNVPFETDRAREQRYLNEMDEKELYLYNKRRGFDLDSLLDGTSPYIDKSAEYLGEGKDFLGKGLFQNYASGGIASLTKTIPPESGQTPHGLPYVYNNVKKI